MISAEQSIPPIREDLQIVRGGISYAGAPIWIVHDPVRNRFFRIPYEMFQLLSVWNHSRNIADLNDALQVRFGREADQDEVTSVVRLLENNYFLATPVSRSWRALHDEANRRESLLMRLVHNYLFFRIPLIRPEKFITTTWPFVAFVFTRTFASIAALFGLLGFYLVSRQWEAFVGSFAYVFSVEGAIVSILSIILVKSLHELGHAYVAHMFGCRIPTMGIAFMFMVPLLYTDVTDAWRLKSRKSRVMIDCAGMMGELFIAAFALFVWAFMQDGPSRSAVFTVASVSWIFSLLVNLNPFMRFDGYYILADYLGVENLQPRAFRYMRWRLREALFALGHPPPEYFPKRLDIIVTLYAIFTTLYRIMLYIGIAVVVYHFTIKVIGVLLFVVEIVFFMIRPAWSELKEWWNMRESILRRRRTYITFLFVLGGATLLFMPLSTRVSAPAIMQPKSFLRLYSEEPGRLESINVKLGQTVEKGAVLFTISSPALTQERKLAEIELRLVKRRLARIGSNSEALAYKSVGESELGRLYAQIAGITAREEKLIIRANFGGQIADLNVEVFPGQWISRKEQLGYLAETNEVVVTGYVSGEERSRVNSTCTGLFIPDDVTQSKLHISVTGVGVSGVRQIDVRQLTSAHGGKLAVYPESGGPLVPVSPQYTVTARVLGQAQLKQTRTGVLLIDTEAESLLARFWRRVLAVLIRESGA